MGKITNEIRFQITAELKAELQALSDKVGISSLQLARSLFLLGLESCKSKLAEGYSILLEPQPVSRLLKIRYEPNGKGTKAKHL